MLNHEQEQQIDILRSEGIIIRQEYLKSKLNSKRAKEQENQVTQYVLDNNIFVYDEKWDKAGERITDYQADFLINEEIYINEFLPKRQEAFKILFNIDNPLDFAYVYPFQEKFWEVEKQFLKIATKFLSLVGYETEAEQLNKSIDGYLKDSFKEQLLKINDNFLVD